MSGNASERDGQRAKVYAAEVFIRTLFDRAAETGRRNLEFFGAELTLPPEARFGSVAAVQRYADDVMALSTVRARWPDATQLTVRARRGATAAHYERSAQQALSPCRINAAWTGRCENWWCCMRLRTICVMLGRRTARSS